MSKLDELIQRLCPDGVEYKSLWSVTVWDKKFNSVSREKQPKVVNYPYLLAKELFLLEHTKGDVFLLSTGEQSGWTTEELAGDNLCIGEVVTIPWGKSRPVIEVMKYYKGKFVTADNRIATSIDTSILLNKYLYYWLLTKGADIDKCYRGAGIQHPDMSSILDFEIPLPPLPVQEEIVRLLDQLTETTQKYQAELEAELDVRKKQYEEYRNKLLDLEGKEGVMMKTLNEVCKNLDRQRIPIASSKREKGIYPYYGASGIVDYVKDYIFDGEYLLISEDGANLLARTTPIAFHIKGKNWVNNHAHILSFENKVTQQYVEFYLNNIDLGPWITGGAQPKLNQENLNKIPIPLPPLAEQERIVNILDRMDKTHKELCQSIETEIKMRKQQYEYYRNQLLDFKKKEE